MILFWLMPFPVSYTHLYVKSEEFYLSDGGMTDERKDLLCYRTQGFTAE